MNIIVNYSCTPQNLVGELFLKSALDVGQRIGGVYWAHKPKARWFGQKLRSTSRKQPQIRMSLRSSFILLKVLL